MAALWRRPWREQRLLLQICLLFGLVELALAICSFHKVLSYFAPDVPAPGRASRSRLLDPPLPGVIALVGRVGSRMPFAATCLKQALVLSWLLSRRGLRVTLRLGVRRDGQLKAHAWLEHEGRIIFGDASPEPFEPLGAVPGRTSR